MRASHRPACDSMFQHAMPHVCMCNEDIWTGVEGVQVDVFEPRVPMCASPSSVYVNAAHFSMACLTSSVRSQACAMCLNKLGISKTSRAAKEHALMSD